MAFIPSDAMKRAAFCEEVSSSTSTVGVVHVTSRDDSSSTAVALPTAGPSLPSEVEVSLKADIAHDLMLPTAAPIGICCAENGRDGPDHHLSANRMDVCSMEQVSEKYGDTIAEESMKT